MTSNPEEPTSGLDRENNQRPDVNQDGSEGKPEQEGKNPQEQRLEDLANAAEEN